MAHCGGIRTTLIAFESFPFANGVLNDLADDIHPCRLLAWDAGRLDLASGATHYLYAFEGTAELACASGTFPLQPGMYASVVGESRIRGQGRGIVITRLGYEGLFSLGGPVERRGRLQYIDGCTDTLLIPPVILGDPCLNLLHIPTGTHQTRHTHPSVRIGVITAGRGRCVTPDGSAKLVPGVIFIIPAEGEHSFHTDDTDLTVIAWHPDSDFGPSVDDHPMVNRTIVEGVAASRLSHERRRITRTPS